MTIILGCIADDFTGATDLANTLVKQGMPTIQLNRWHALFDERIRQIGCTGEVVCNASKYNGHVDPTIYDVFCRYGLTFGDELCE